MPPRPKQRSNSLRVAALSTIPGIVWTQYPADEFGRHAAEWDALAAASRYPAFLESRFLGQAISDFGCPNGLLLFGHRGSTPVAATILQRAPPGVWSTFQPSQLPLGAWVMARDGDWEELLAALLRQLPGIAVSVGVTRQDPALVPRPANSRRLEALDYVPTAWVEVDGSFEDFWNARGKNLRQNLRKQRRKLERQGAVLAFEFCDRADDVLCAFRQFAALESAGWKGAEGSAISLDNTQGRFYLRMLDGLAQSEAAFALRLTPDGVPIAVDFGVIDGDRASILKTTYDEKLAAFSPAQLLHEQALEYFFHAGRVRRVEFYGKVMEWHTRWTDKSRMLFHVNAYRPAVLKWLWQRSRVLRSRLARRPARRSADD